MVTTRQKKLAKRLSENIRKDGKKIKPIGKIMREVGYSESASKRPNIATKGKGFIDLLEKSGVSDRLLAKKLKEGLDATKPISCNVYIKDLAGNELELKAADGLSKDFIDIEDYSTRHKYVVTSLELRGHIKNHGNGHSVSVVNINYGHRQNRGHNSPIRQGSGDTGTESAESDTAEDS